MVKQNNITFDVFEIDTSLFTAAKTINCFIKRNKIDLQLKIEIDMDCEKGNCGYYSFAKDDEYKIFINPLLCESSTDKDSDHFPCSYNDLSMYGTAVHEFCHLLSNTQYKGITEHFKELFATTRLFLNNNSAREADEEFCEACVVYITNPYLLKLISVDHWRFFNVYFKASVSCSEKTCRKFYDNFPFKVKETLKDKWNIIQNAKTLKIERVKK
jgi:hypothetical protein